MNKHYYQNLKGFFDFQGVYSRMVSEFNNAHFVEVGVMYGKSAAYMAVEIANSGKNIRFDVVDIWIDKNIKAEALKNLREFDVNIINKSSVEAAKLYKNNSIDFVFIDAAHDYDSVKADIKAWLPKVKQGGYIGGHDYGEPCGVKQAVDEAFKNIEKIGTTWLVKK